VTRRRQQAARNAQAGIYSLYIAATRRGYRNRVTYGAAQIAGRQNERNGRPVYYVCLASQPIAAGESIWQV